MRWFIQRGPPVPIILDQDLLMLTAIEETESSAPPAIVAATRQAEITAVPRNEAGRVLNPLNIWIAVALTLLPIAVGLIGGIGGLVIAACVFSRSAVAAGVFAVAGLACGIGSVFALVSFQHVLASRFLRWKTCHAFAGRLDPLVRPDDPEAGFVDFLPRSHWGQNMLEPATDVGFLKIDRPRRELLLEGDLKRYRIPFEAVADCQIEEYALGREQWEADLHFVTVLTVETSTGPREVPLACRHLNFTPRRAAQRRAEADDLCSRILIAINR
jgi:hypothetical protein